jgi:DNA-binding transcriptional LysR family regulator
LELRQLRYVLAVAEEQNLTRAAERLGMQPPPLSRQIRAVEREVGSQLFRRKARGVEVTDAGRVFIDNARAIFALLDSTFDATRRTARGEQGRISVAYSSTVAFHRLVPRIIREFRETFPLVTVTLTEGYPERMVERMQQGEIDVCFVRRVDPEMQRVDIAVLDQEAMLVALPSSHRLAQKQVGAISLKALSDETFILFGDPHGDALERNSDFTAACREAGFKPRVGHVVPYISSRLNLVAAGLGIAVVAASLEHVKIDGLAFRPLKGLPLLKQPLGLAYRRGDSSPVVRHFLSLAKRTAKARRSVE